MTTPPPPTDCWPLTYPQACAPAFDPDSEGYDAETAGLAIALAVTTLRILTAYRVGGCPVVLRPATARCRDWCYGGPTWTPVLDVGQWINVPCGCTDTPCRCGHLSQLLLPGPVGVVDEVRINGTVLDESAWRLVGNVLHRVDGSAWPRWQNLDAAISGPDTFAVTYTTGEPVDGLGARAAGVLACEYRTALTDPGKCGLPRNATQVVRNNVSMVLADPQGRLFPNGLTGIYLVDSFVARWNPHGLRSPSTVWSPDVPVPSITRSPA